MRSVEEIRNDIAETKTKIERAVNERAALKIEVGRLKESNRKLHLEHVGTAKPEELKTQRQKIFEIQEARAELRDVIGYLEDRRENGQRELELSYIFEGVAKYWAQEQAFFNGIEEIKDAGKQMNESILKFEECVAKLKYLGNPQKLLASLLRKVKGRVGYEFFLSGEIEKPNLADDNTFVNTKIVEYSSVKRSLPELGKLKDLDAELDSIASAMNPVGYGSVLKALLH